MGEKCGGAVAFSVMWTWFPEENTNHFHVVSWSINLRNQPGRLKGTEIHSLDQSLKSHKQ